jgi:hypothetical protein
MEFLRDLTLIDDPCLTILLLKLVLYWYEGILVLPIELDLSSKSSLPITSEVVVMLVTLAL